MALERNGGKYFQGNLVCDTLNGVETYVALLTQTGTSAPVATVLRNDLDGTVVWSYVSPGVYRATLAGAFLADKTAVLITGGGDSILGATWISANIVEIYSQNLVEGDFQVANGLLSGASIKIMVFNT